MHGQDVAVVGGDLVHITPEPHRLDYFGSIAWMWRLLQGSSCQGGDLLAQDLGDPWQDTDWVLNNGRGADASSHLAQRSLRWSLHVGQAALPVYMQAQTAEVSPLPQPSSLLSIQLLLKYGTDQYRTIDSSGEN